MSYKQLAFDILIAAILWGVINTTITFLNITHPAYCELVGWLACAIYFFIWMKIHDK